MPEFGRVTAVPLYTEHYQLLTWLGAAIITAGVFITTKAQSQAGAPAQVRIEPAASRS